MTSGRDGRRPISGWQAQIGCGDYQAQIASVGASLRALTCRGRDLVAPFDADIVRPVFRGAVLVPWPNRVVGGRYVFDGQVHQLPINEPDRGNALHGLAAWADWVPIRCDRSSVTLEYRIPAQEGYPFDVLTEATYRLDEDGLHWSVRATNLGDSPAPYALGSHPYLVGGAGRADDWTLAVPAAQVLEVTEERLAPLGLHPVESYRAGALDFRSARPVGSTLIDHAYTDLIAGEPGTARVEVRSGGTGVALIWDPQVLPWVQVHTADRPEPALNRSGIAVEPMTCPPDAFNSGDDLVILDPGARHEASWVIRAIQEDR